MESRIYNVNLQSGYNTLTYIGISQYDTGVPLQFNVYDGATAASFPAGTTATIMGVRPSGVGFSIACTLTDNVVTVNSSTDMTGEAGKFPVEIRFEYSGVDVGTVNFIFLIEKAPHPDGTIDADITREQSIITRLEAQEVIVNPVFEIGKDINASGVIAGNPYRGLSNIIQCQGGDIIVNNTPARDSNNVLLNVFIATYKTVSSLNDTFVARTGLTSGQTFVFGDDITGFRIAFGRNASSGVTLVEADLSYLSITYCLKGASVQEWRAFELAYNAQLPQTITGYTTMITTAARLATVTGGTNSVNDFPVNKIVCVGAAAIGLTDYPTVSADGTGVYLTYQYSNGGSAGQAQLYIGTNGHATRWKNAGGWKPWASINVNTINAEETYYVGGNSGNDSLTSLLIDLKDNENKKVIYIYPGTYDIFAEYQTEVTNGRLSVPPDTIQASDYFYPYNAFVPNNTRLIGLGDVLLSWNPSSADITYGAARTWSPLNCLGNVDIENINIYCHNGRYCIHDDSHSDYPNTKHVYKNVNCVYVAADSVASGNLGYNNTIGFGFGDGCIFEFDNCNLFYDGAGDHGVFYGHGRSGTDKTTGVIVVNGCVLRASDATNKRVIRLETISQTVTNRIITKFANCYINGGLQFVLDYAATVQSFDVELLKSGSPVITYIGDGSADNDPYTVTVY